MASSPRDPSTFILPCNDRTIRIWNTSKKTNRFITTIIWKGLDKKYVNQVFSHQTEESIIALACKKEIVLMDIHAHTPIAEFQIP